MDKTLEKARAHNNMPFVIYLMNAVMRTPTYQSNQSTYAFWLWYQAIRWDYRDKDPDPISIKRIYHKDLIGWDVNGRDCEVCHMHPHSHDWMDLDINGFAVNCSNIDRTSPVSTI